MVRTIKEETASGKPESFPLPILQQTAQQNSTGRKVVLNRPRISSLLPSQQTLTPGILARHGPLRAKQFLLVESSRNDPLPRKMQQPQDVLARNEEVEERARTGFAGDAAGTGLVRTIKEETAAKARNSEAPKDRQAGMLRRRLEGALTTPDMRGDCEEERQAFTSIEHEGFLPPNTRKATAFSTSGEDREEIDSASDFFPNTLEDDHSLDEESEADLLDCSECSDTEETAENYEEPGDQEEEELPVSPRTEEELGTALPTHTRALQLQQPPLHRRCPCRSCRPGRRQLSFAPPCLRSVSCLAEGRPLLRQLLRFNMHWPT